MTHRMGRTAIWAASLAVLILVQMSSAVIAAPFDEITTQPEASDQWAKLFPSAREAAVAAAAAQDPEPHEPVGGRGPRRWWSIALSAAVPGLGEAVTGHKRGYAMIAADAGLIYGAYDRNQRGDEIVEEYKAFADLHYDEDEWARFLREGALEEYFPNQTLVAGTPREGVALYVSREEDEREWYENIGKWDVFAWGWREYWEDDYYPGDPADLPNLDPGFGTPLRTEYVAMRGESKDVYDTRDIFVNASLLLRVFSVLQVAYLEGFIGGRYNSASVSSVDYRELPPQLTWYVSPPANHETRFGVEVRY